MKGPAIVSATGRGVRVAVVDSGVIAHHPHVMRLAGGFGVDAAPDGSTRRSLDYRDRNGHGTACAGVIRWGAPDAEIVAVRVLDAKLTASAAVIAEALEGLREDPVDVINFSLGVPEDTHRADLAARLQVLLDAGTVAVAAARADGGTSWPSNHPGVIAVAADPERGPWAYGPARMGDAVISARPWPRPIPGQPETHNFAGTSFAAPRKAALAARVCEVDPGADVDRVLTLLNEAAPWFGAHGRPGGET